jgi:hypothetical protein
VNRYDYDAFGNAVAANTSEQVENRYRFQGLATQATTSRPEAEAQEDELNIMSPELHPFTRLAKMYRFVQEKQGQGR